MTNLEIKLIAKLSRLTGYILSIDGIRIDRYVITSWVNNLLRINCEIKNELEEIVNSIGEKNEIK